MSVTSYIQSLIPAVQQDYQKTGVLPSITIAQAVLEGGSGGSDLASKYNNIFGMKTGGGWKGKSIIMDTKEQDKYGNVIKQKSAFRWYDSVQESIRDHSNNFWKGTRYKPFLEASKKGDYKEASQALQGVYATDKHYASKLNNVIQQYDLSKLDKGQQPDPSIWAKNAKDSPNSEPTATDNKSNSLNPMDGINQTLSTFFTQSLPSFLASAGWIIAGIIFIVIGIFFLFADEDGTGGGGLNVKVL